MVQDAKCKRTRMAKRPRCIDDVLGARAWANAYGTGWHAGNLRQNLNGSSIRWMSAIQDNVSFARNLCLRDEP